MGQQVISVEEARDLYPDQWVLIRVTEYKHHAPVAGVVLAAGSDEYVQAALVDRIRSGCPDPPYHRFFAFKHLPTEEEVQEMLEQVWVEELEAILQENEQGRSGGDT